MSDIFRATEVGDRDQVVKLLDTGVKPNGRSVTGLTALHWAASMNQRTIARLLIDRGADPASESPLGTPERCARVNNHSKLANELARLTRKESMSNIRASLRSSQGSSDSSSSSEEKNKRKSLFSKRSSKKGSGKVRSAKDTVQYVKGVDSSNPLFVH